MSGFPFSFEPWVKLRSATTAWGGVLASITAKKGPRKVIKVKKNKKKRNLIKIIIILKNLKNLSILGVT